MADITPGITHAVKAYDESICGIEITSEWEEDDDAEFIYSNDLSEVNCNNCLRNLKEENNNE